MDLSFPTRIRLRPSTDEFELLFQVRGDAHIGREAGSDPIPLGGQVGKVGGEVLKVQLFLVSQLQHVPETVRIVDQRH